MAPSCPYVGSAVVHLMCGFACVAAGVVFILLLVFYPPLLVSDGSSGDRKTSVLYVWEPWLGFLFANKIWCGFWFIITGVVGLTVRRKGTAESCYTALSVLNVLVWSLAVMVLNAFFVYCVISAFDVFGKQSSFEGVKPLWLLVFPAVGLLFGFIEFITSIVSCSMACCCSPAAFRQMNGKSDMYHLETATNYEYRQTSRF